MKKVLTVMLTLGLMAAGVANADNERAISPEQLPQSAKTFITTYFPQAEITYAKSEHDDGRKTYEVYLSDNTKIEFDKKGEWKHVDCERAAVPQGIVPAPIADKIKELYPAARIESIDKDRRDIEIELNNGTDLKFSLDYQLLEVDR